MIEDLTPDRLEAYIESLKSRIEIDRYNLANECVKQPSLYQEVSEKLSGLVKKSKAAKERVERIKAKLDIAIRQNPDDYGLKGIKITESVVSSAILQAEEYQEAYDSYLIAEEMASLYSSVVTSVDVKKSMIRDLVTLAERDYYQERAVEPMHSEANKANAVRAEQYAKARSARHARRREEQRERDAD